MIIQIPKINNIRKPKTQQPTTKRINLTKTNRPKTQRTKSNRSRLNPRANRQKQHKPPHKHKKGLEHPPTKKENTPHNTKQPPENNNF
jgi:hypothetical protein